MRFMVRFQQSVEEIRERHRLRFEKFLGDGAFYSARSARAVLLAAAELRILYERLRRQGFPFDRGLRLAINVGSYHLLTCHRRHERLHRVLRPRYGRAARLTTEDHGEVGHTDFLIASGCSAVTVLERSAARRHPEHARATVRAFLIENDELVNLKSRQGVPRDPRPGAAAAWRADATTRMLVLPCDRGAARRTVDHWRSGTALSGLDPTPLRGRATSPAACGAGDGLLRTSAGAGSKRPQGVLF
jgi:hypothetical protein